MKNRSWPLLRDDVGLVDTG